MHTENDVDGDMLIQLTEEQNAADLKELCPVLKHRLQLRSWVKMASTQPTAPSPQHCEMLQPTAPSPQHCEFLQPTAAGPQCCEILGASASVGTVHSHEVNMQQEGKTPQA